MKRERGERGVRNYQREARRLVRAAACLATACVITASLAAVLFFFGRTDAAGVVYVAVTADYLTETPRNSPVEMPGFLARQEQTDETPPIFPINWGIGMFFDPRTGKIVLPDGVAVAELRHDDLYTTHEIMLKGIHLPRRNIRLLRYNTIATGILLDGGRIVIRTYRGAFVNYGQNETYRYIQLIDPREEYHTIVVIDPGHGGHQPGAASALGRAAPFEAEINLDISLMLKEIFDEPGVRLVFTRTEDIYVCLGQRYRLANVLGDYFISIHCNADAQSRFSQGTLTLYGGASGSHELARMFQDALVAEFESRDRGIHKATEFRILRGANVPSAILELLFLSNPQEAARLSDPDVQMQIARTIADVIAALPPARENLYPADV